MSLASDVHGVLASSKAAVMTAAEIMTRLPNPPEKSARLYTVLIQMTDRGEIVRDNKTAPPTFRLNPRYEPSASRRRQMAAHAGVELPPEELSIPDRVASVLRGASEPLRGRDIRDLMEEPPTSALLYQALRQMTERGELVCDDESQPARYLLDPAYVRGKPIHQPSPEAESTASTDKAAPPPAPTAPPVRLPGPPPSTTPRPTREPATPRPSAAAQRKPREKSEVNVHKTAAVGKSEALPSTLQHPIAPDPVANVLAQAIAQWLLTIVPPQLLDELGAAIASRKAA